MGLPSSPPSWLSAQVVPEGVLGGHLFVTREHDLSPSLGQGSARISVLLLSAGSWAEAVLTQPRAGQASGQKATIS